MSIPHSLQKKKKPYSLFFNHENSEGKIAFDKFDKIGLINSSHYDDLRVSGKE